jgi:hypothetical protein
MIESGRALELEEHETLREAGRRLDVWMTEQNVREGRIECSSYGADTVRPRKSLSRVFALRRVSCGLPDLAPLVCGHVLLLPPARVLLSHVAAQPDWPIRNQSLNAVSMASCPMSGLSRGNRERSSSSGERPLLQDLAIF